MVAGPVTPVDDREGIRRIQLAQHEKYGADVTDDPGPFRYFRLEPQDGWAWLDSTTVKVDARWWQGETTRPLTEPAPAKDAH